MRRRISKTPASPIGDQLRRESVAFRNDGQPERAEGYLDAANRIDAWLFAHKGPLERHLEETGKPAPQGDLSERVEALEESVGNLALLVASYAKSETAPAASKPNTPPEVAPRSNGAAHLAHNPSATHHDASLSRMERKVLTAIVQMGGEASEEVLLLLTGYQRSGSWTQALASLRHARFLDGLSITGEGRRVVGTVDPLPRGDRLLTYWTDKLGPMAGAILRSVLANTLAHESVPEDVVRRATSYQKSGSWTQAVSNLRKLHLLTPRGDFAIPEATRDLLLHDGADG